MAGGRCHREAAAVSGLDRPQRELGPAVYDIGLLMPVSAGLAGLQGPPARLLVLILALLTPMLRWLLAVLAEAVEARVGARIGLA